VAGVVLVLRAWPWRWSCVRRAAAVSIVLGAGGVGEHGRAGGQLPVPQ
jgi:hypothetical protein